MTCFSHQYLLQQQKKKSRHSASGHAYEGVSDILKRKDGHIRKHLCEKRVNQGSRTVLGGDPSLKIDQVGIPKDICQVFTKPMLVNSLNYDQVENLMREKKDKLYSERKTKTLFEISQAHD